MILAHHFIKVVLKRLRVTTMNEKACLSLAFLLYIAVVSESRVIVPPTEDESFGTEEIPFSMNPLETGKKLDPSAVDDYDYYGGVPMIGPPHKYPEPEKFPPGADRDENPQEYPKEDDGIDKLGDENLNKPLDREDFDKFDDNDKDLGPSTDDGKSIYKEDKESEIRVTDLEESEDKNDKEYKPEYEENPDEEKKEDELDEVKPDEEKEEEELDEEKPDEEKEEEEEELDEEKLNEDKKEELDEEKPDGDKKEEELDEEKPEEDKKEEEDEEKVDEERKIEEEEEEKHEHEIDGNKKHIPEEDSIDDNNKEEIPKEVDEETDENDNKEEDGIPEKGDAGSFKDNSIFDTPFFNIEKVKKYFGHLDRALGHVFQQTMDEALLLNGTYANTTEEEVDIDGKKYIVTKSVIKGADNHSSMYIESLSAKPKMNDTEGMKDIEIKNLTQT